MKKTNVNYPHPVLSASNEDYLNSSFDIAFLNDPQIEGDTITLSMEYALSCPSLENYVSTGGAKIVVYIESPVAEYREMFSFDTTENARIITINKNDVNRKLEIKGYLIATKSLTPFKLPEHNKELVGEIPFNIRPGDILAVSEHFFNIPIEMYDPLADRPSIFSIRQQFDHPNEEVMVDFLSDQKIKILLNTDTYEKYRKLYEAPEVRTILASFFAAPVLVDVLGYMKNANDEDLEALQDKKWFAVINSRLLALNINLKNEESMTRVANQVLPHVFKMSVESFGQLFDALIPAGGENNEN